MDSMWPMAFHRPARRRVAHAMTDILWYDYRDMVVGLLAGVAGVGAGYTLRSLVGRWQANSIEKRAQTRFEEIEVEVRNRLKEADIQARAEVVKAREEFEKSTKARRKELQDIEDRLLVREENLDRKVELVDRKEQTVNQRQEETQARLADVNARRQELDRALADAQGRLQRLAGMTAEEARRDILQRMELECRADAAGVARRLQEEARADAEREARRVITMAVQRYAAPHAAEMMTSTVPLPSDDVKGRIIGREGRNIRALEAATGVNMLIDDTPEAVVVSGFDPIRREIARQALEQLVADGRIHPARIEEVVAKVQEEMEATIRQQGEQAVYDARLQGVDAELMHQLGRLKFRTSFSQNVLQHSLEVAHLMGMMAGELGLDAAVARRVGLFHDIGKSADHEAEGGHAAIGAEILKRFHEDPIVVNAVAAHHGEVEAGSLYGVLCSAADAISSSRPGARVESTSVYVQRLEKLEAIANGMPGVRKTFAVQAGREVRVIVDPVQIDDAAAILLARDISKRIETELRYPGQIRVVVVRETRCVEFAR
jgi:ribonuclease Y